MGTDILFSSAYQADQALFSQLSRMEDIARVAVADIDEE
jgi:hypothetical protein